MVRLPSKPLPPLANNATLKGSLRRVDREGSYDDKTLAKIIEDAGNISSEEHAAIVMTIGADDIRCDASEDAVAHFHHILALESHHRQHALSGELRAGIVRGLTGMATGLAAVVAVDPIIDGNPHRIALTVLAAITGAVIGFTRGAKPDYGVHS